MDFIFDFFKTTSSIDLFFLILLVFSIIQCTNKGFVLSLLAASKWLLSYILTLYLFPKAKPYVSDLSKNEYVLDIILGTGIFIIILFIILMINKSIGKAIKYTGIGGIDRFFGFFFGILRTYIVCICVFSTVNNFFDYKNWPINVDNSITFPYIEKGSSFLSNEFPNKEEYQDAKENIQEL